MIKKNILEGFFNDQCHCVLNKKRESNISFFYKNKPYKNCGFVGKRVKKMKRFRK